LDFEQVVIVLRAIPKYIADHWRGRQDLAWSIVVNLLLLRLAISVAQAWLSPAEGSDYSGGSVWVYLLAIFFHGIVFVWQVVGVLRAAEHHIRNKGGMAGMWGAQLCAILAFWFTATDAFDAWQMSHYIPEEENFALRMDREHASRYTLTASGEILRLSGTIELGVSRRLARELAANPAASVIVLDSDGGNIYEARGLSKLIRDNGMDTRTESRCSSACTTVFIAGKRRSMTADAQLGFHQYRLEADYDVPNADPAAEQERDRAFYADSGVAEWFQKKMFESTADNMWFPTGEELIAAGVVHEISQ
jgi:hypothetical protein